MTSEHSDDGNSRVTFTYTAPSGAVIVVRNVPAKNAPSDSSQVVYSLTVASKLQDLVQSALATADVAKITDLSYDDTPVQRDADYEFKFVGSDTNFLHARVQTWRLIFDKLHTATKTAIRATTKNFSGRIPADMFPTVAFVRPSSIGIGVRTSEQTSMFQTPGDEPSKSALRYLMATTQWLGGEGALPAELEDDDVLLEGILRAVEELAPPNDPSSVALVKIEDISNHTSTEFTREKRERAKDKRLDIRLKRSPTLRKIDIIGTIDILDLSKKVHLRDVEETTEWRSQIVANAVFAEDLLAPLLENFGKRVHVTAFQEKMPDGTWSRQIEIVDVRRIDEKSDLGG
ncbi:MAG TPA: hypothetical protein VMW12_05145 [Candidatus Dormibacteraeota bacterium]|nr:hypothetical protein [Candidatus Dormibacteraeota bacterium]